MKENTTLNIRVELSQRSDFESVKTVAQSDQQGLRHSRGPAFITGSTPKKIYLFKLYDENNTLVAYFPFEQTKTLGITIIKTAFHDLNLNYVDIAVEPKFQQASSQIFINWIKSKKNTAVCVGTCAQDADFVKLATQTKEFKVETLNKYRSFSLPESYEKFTQTNNVKDSPYDKSMVFDVVAGKLYGDELIHCVNQFSELNRKNAGAKDMSDFIEKGLTDETIFLIRAREVITGNVVASALMSISESTVGWIREGRRSEDQYKGLDSWLFLKSVDWAIAHGKTRYEILINDGDDKIKYSTNERNGVQMLFFSSPRAKITFKLHEIFNSKSK